MLSIPAMKSQRLNKPGVAYRDVGKGREHDCMDAGGRAPKVGALGDAGAVAEERKL